MHHILMIDNDNFTYRDLERKPLAGTMSGFISLVRAFEESGYHVTVRTSSTEVFQSSLVDWKSLKDPIPELPYRVFIANRFPRLFGYYPACKNRVLWMRNTGKYLFRWKSFRDVVRYWPAFAFTSEYHKRTYPSFFPGGKRYIIPHGLDLDLITKNQTEQSNLNVAFTSNPLRSLDWLVDLWTKYIHPAVPAAELHVFASHTTYGAWGERVRHLMDPVMEKVKRAAPSKVVLRDPLPKPELLHEIGSYRAMFYRGDPAETFCFAIAEAQALGLPCVVQDSGCMTERVVHNETGFVENNDEQFAKRCIEILKDDRLFVRLRDNARRHYAQLSWKNAAHKFLEVGQ